VKNIMQKKFKKIFKVLCISPLLIIFINLSVTAEVSRIDLIKTNWSFEGIFGKFDRAALQRGYQIYNEACSSCHSIQYLSYRNLTEKGGPEFSKEQAKKLPQVLKLWMDRIAKERCLLVQEDYQISL